ncbi:MAG TPA: DMT family transporter [Candidatus Saccharimonadales bacterium]|nr:DMT family transporter [Candidatus Saccharimonadales bacterium]
MPSPAPTERQERDGLLLAAAAAILYGAAYPATAIALRSFTPLAIAGLACTLALPVVIALGATGVLPRPSRAAMHPPNLVRLAVLGGLGGIGFIALVNVAVSLSGSTVTGFIAPLYAVAAALLAVPILGERLRLVTLAAFALAIIGTVLLAGGVPNGEALAGILLAAAAAAMFGLYIVLARRWAGRYHLDATLITVATLIGRGPMLLAIEVVRSDGALWPASPDPAAVVALLTIAFGSSSSANLLLMASVRRVAAGRASAALLLTPVSSAIIGAVLLHEVLTPVELLGAAMVLAGIAVASGLLDRWLAVRRGDRGDSVGEIVPIDPSGLDPGANGPPR